MGLIDWARSLFGKVNKQTTPAGTIEKAFGVQPAASRLMDDNVNLWWSMYTNEPPWKTRDVRPLGLPGAIGRELASHALTEFSVTVSGGARGDFINEQIRRAARDFKTDLELGLCLGGIALKPYPDGGRILVDASATSFTPTRFDGTGKCVGGVFKSGPVRQGREWFIKLEYHDTVQTADGGSVYTVQNKAFKSSRDGSIGEEVSLEAVDAWAELEPEQQIEGLEGPLFACFKPPVANRVEPSSPLGVSVYSGEVAELIRQADEQWEQIRWEFKSGKRKIIADAAIEPGQVDDRLFVKGMFTGSGELFQVFSPEFRNSSIYDGLQYILKLIEFSVGLAFGTISDPQSVNKTATEEIMTKHRQYVTEGDIQAAFEETLNDLIYAVNAWCDLAQLAPAGDYEVEYNWGDGVLDDPETRRQDMAMGIQLMGAAVMGPLEFRMKYFGENEKTARSMLPGAEDMATGHQEEVE